MRGLRALCTGMLAITLALGAMPPPLLGATGDSPDPAAAALARVPDPVTFVPGARPKDINTHMEATIGFGTRGLPGKSASQHGAGPASPPATPGTRLPEEPRVDREPKVDPAPPAPAKASPPPGSAPQAFGDGTPTIAAAGSPQVTGVLKTANGDPLVGAHVCLLPNTGTGSCLYYATTTAGGAFAVTGVDGSYFLGGWEDSGVYLPMYWNSAGSKLYQADAETITLAGSDRTGINFTLSPYPRVKGKVTDGVGAALQDMYISSSGYPTDNVVTDSNGNYSVKVWPGVSTTIQLNATAKYRFGWWSSGGTVLDQSLATPIPVGWTDVTGKNLTPVPWPKVSGRLTDKNGAGIAFLQVVADKPYEHIVGATDANGYYTLYLHNGGSGWTVGAGGIDPWIGNSAAVQVVDQDSTINLTMHRYPHVAGTVTNSNGDPIAGVTISAYDSNGPKAVTDAQGHVDFVFYEYLTKTSYVSYSDPSGTYVNGWLGPSGFTDIGAEAGNGFTLVPDQVLNVSTVLPRYGMLTGHLRLADGTPVSNTWISPTRPGGYATSGQTGGDGSFSIKVVPDSYHVWVGGGWYGSEGFGYYEGAVKPFAVGESGASIEMYLPPTSGLSGRVTSGSTPLAGIEVDIYLAGSPYTYVSTAADGTYHVDLPPGQYQVGFYDGSITHGHGWYRPSGYTSDPDLAALVSVGAGADTTGINVSLPAIRHISGKVVDLTTSTAISQPFVEAFVNGVYYSSVLGSTSGTFNLPVAPGAVTLWIYDLNLIHAPGWRTSTGISADWALAAATTVGTSDVTGVTIKTPEAGLLKLFIPGQANAEAVVNGGATSFAQRQTNGDLLMPVIKGSYKLWIDYDAPTSTQVAGWVKSSTLTADAAQATLKSITTTTATLTVTLPTAGQMSGWARAGQVVDVLVYANGNPYLESYAGSGAFTFTVPVGTYRLAFLDPFAHFVAGWLGPSGFVTSYAQAKDVVVTASGVSDLNLDLPLGPPPSAPAGATAVPYNNSAGVSFTPPATTADRPFTHFTVTAAPGGRQCITVTRSCIVTGLANGTAYTFRVTASTITGYSVPSAASNSVTPKPVPDAPFGLSAVTTGADVQLSWVAPASNGSAITGYTATAQPGGATCMPSPPTQTTCTIHGLADGRYSVSITATNALGSGPPATVGALVDTTAPTVTGPTVALRSGVVMSGSSIPVTISWTASDALSGVFDTSLEVKLGTGAYTARTLSSMTATSYSGTLTASSSAYSFRDRALDASGNLSAWAVGASRILGIKQQNGTGVTYSGTWYTWSTTSALGGSIKYTSGKNSVSYTFTGRGIAFVTRKGTNAGTAYVYIDGVKVATLSMYASTTSYRWVAFAKNWSTSATHTIKIVNAATSGHPRLYVDAFLTIK